MLKSPTTPPFHVVRFSMPGGTESMYFSFNIGPVHFISISTEFYYYTGYGTDQVFSQYNWLLQDLEVGDLTALEVFCLLLKQNREKKRQRKR